MKRSGRSRLLWTVWMCLGGVAVAATVYGITSSLGWAVIALVLSGPVLNAIGRAITQPTRAVRGGRHHRV
jgi:ABC-type Fe3+-siderophore transport system permease subunit